MTTAETAGEEPAVPRDDAAGAAGDGDLGAAPQGEEAHLDVRTILAEIGAEETFARHEGRLAGLEDDLERVLARLEESERRQQGELAVMRARVDDALHALEGSAGEHRDATSKIEERIAAAAASSEAVSRELVSDLREELSPRIQRAMYAIDETAAELRGQLEAAADDTTARVEDLAGQVAEVHALAGDAVARADVTAEEAARQQAEGLAALEARLGMRLDDQAERLDSQTQAAADRVEGLRRELDAATGELRAGLHLRAQALEEAVADARADLADRLEEREAAAADLERRWVQGAREIARRIEAVSADARGAVEAERARREEAQAALRARLDEHTEVVEELRVRLSASVGRRETDLEQLRRSLDEVQGHVEILQGRLASAVGQVVGALTEEVSQLSGDLEALRESSMEQGQRLAGLEHLGRRVSELTARHESVEQRLSERGRDEQVERVATAVTELRDRLGSVDAAVQANGERGRALQSAVAELREGARGEQGLRQEVRDLAARCAELARRVAEAEELARTAGRAIVGLGRRLERGEGGRGSEIPAVRAIEGAGQPDRNGDEGPLFSHD